jgi:peptide-methionine (R)-S-oxide reductase
MTRRSAVLAILFAKTARSISTVRIVDFDAAGRRKGIVTVDRVIRTDAEWRKQLDLEQYEVTRHADTEEPFSGMYWDNHQRGLYRCICCATALFDSETKFDSRTGWPSFRAPIARENIVTRTDTSLDWQRTEVRCARCDAHLGHVFDDGPPPAHLRYCMNSAALLFVAR